jgi:hypothetical protein
MLGSCKTRRCNKGVRTVIELTKGVKKLRREDAPRFLQTTKLAHVDKRSVRTPADTKRSTHHQPSVGEDTLSTLDEAVLCLDPGVLLRGTTQGSSGGFEGWSLQEVRQRTRRDQSNQSYDFRRRAKEAWK